MQSNQCIIGVDIGGTKCAVSLGRPEHGILKKYRFPTEKDRGPDHAFRKMLEGIEQLLKGECHQPMAIGVSVGAMFDPAFGVIGPAPHLPGWEGFPIVESLGEEFSLPTFADNDANACALAEWKYGAGRGCEHVIFLTFGTGLGAGMILNGRLYRGAVSLAGEIGAIRVAEDGPPVRGKPGCVEGYASGAGIAQLAVTARANYRQESVLSSTPSAEEVGHAAIAGDALAQEILADSGRRLGQGLAVLLDLLNPQRIILGSIFVRCEPFLRPAMAESIRRDAMPETIASCQILPATLGESIGDFAGLAIAEMGLDGELPS